MKCVYCKKEILDGKRPKGNKDYLKVYESSEHIIQNALGGNLESTRICCDRCNFWIEKIIDADFTKIFAPIIASIDSIRKTNNTNSQPKYTGTVYSEENEKIQLFDDAILKRGKVVQSNKLIEKEKLEGTNNLNNRINAAKKNMNEMFRDFNLKNDVFKKGMIKIAFNYAISQNIRPNHFDNIVEVILNNNSGELENVIFNTNLITFVPSNDFDKYLELNTDIEISHSLILYTLDGDLYCYIDLFNTFQYYVPLGEKYSNKSGIDIINHHFQYVQKNKQTTKTLYDLPDNAKVLSKLRNLKMGWDFYIGDEQKFRENYRIICPLKKVDEIQYLLISCPTYSVDLINMGKQEEINAYTTGKFLRLTLDSVLKKEEMDADDMYEKMSKDDKEKFISLLLRSYNLER